MAAKHDIFEIEVLGWDKHNDAKPKSKKMAFTYFMVSNRIFSDPKMVGLTTSERLLYVILLTYCSEARSKEIRCSREGIRMLLGTSKEAVEKQLYSLERNQLVRRICSASLIREEKRREEKEKGKSSSSDLLIQLGQVPKEILNLIQPDFLESLCAHHTVKKINEALPEAYLVFKSKNRPDHTFPTFFARYLVRDKPPIGPKQSKPEPRKEAWE